MRITQSHRETIIARALKEAFDKRKTALVKVEQDLAIEAYSFLFDEPTRRKVNGLHKDWFRTCNCLMFTVLGKLYSLNSKNEVRTPYEAYCSNLGTLTGDVADKVEAHYNAKTDLEKEYETAKIKLAANLSNISSFKRLTELWPEGKTFYADLDEDAKVKGGLPAIRFDDMNAMLGITKKAA